MHSAHSNEKICNHIEKYIGVIDNVFKEIISGVLSIDILILDPTPERNFYTLITSGMSELPMTVPEGAEEYQYAELMICLPPTWKLSDEAFKDERNYWPIRALKTMARFPHEYNTWLYMGHTLVNGNPAQPYSEDTGFQGMFVWVPDVKDKAGFFNLEMTREKVVHFYTLIPLYGEELDYKIKHSEEELLHKLNKIGVTDVLDPSRKNSCKKLWGLF
ncbi:suppressor of fused domain protein [Paenibacillus sp. FSL H7-0943]|uniref:suppressor of fused domain protein n=1 Tax=Paenibacillus sp. FSL H7-0943 TaxID=2954739 RepID=UPI0030CCC5A8